METGPYFNNNDNYYNNGVSSTEIRSNRPSKGSRNKQYKNKSSKGKKRRVECPSTIASVLFFAAIPLIMSLIF